MFAEQDGGQLAWYLPAFSFSQDTPLGAKTAQRFSWRRQRGDADSPLFLLNHWVDDFPPRPAANKRIGGNVLRTRVARCSRQRDQTPDVLAVDYYDTSGVVGIARAANEPRSRASRARPVACAVMQRSGRLIAHASRTIIAVPESSGRVDFGAECRLITSIRLASALARGRGPGSLTLRGDRFVSSESSAASDGKDAGALSVHGLGKRFGDRVAFQDVSFEIDHGEVFGFLGPNGAGKTTTVRTLGTLIAPSSGSATVAGIPLAPENGVEIRRRISIMPETPGVYLRLSVAENLECFADLYGVPDSDDRIDRALRAVNLTDRAHDPCGTLSKGLRQRVALARALLSDPEVLFLDEPTAGLDPVATRDVHELIAALGRSGVTIFLTTHRLEEAERLCDRVAILNTTLRTIGRPDELRDQLFANTLTVRTLAPLAEPDSVFAGLPAVAGWRQDDPAGYVLAVSESAVAAPAVTRALVAAGADVLSIGESRHSLEDVYLELIGEDEEAGRR